jgi:hypothetical protein
MELIWVETHFGDLGWDTAVALATFLLALLTGGLAWQTWKLAKSTQADVNAQERPVLLFEPPFEFVWTRLLRPIDVAKRSHGWNPPRFFGARFATISRRSRPRQAATWS